MHDNIYKDGMHSGLYRQIEYRNYDNTDNLNNDENNILYNQSVSALCHLLSNIKNAIPGRLLCFIEDIFPYIIPSQLYCEYPQNSTMAVIRAEGGTDEDDQQVVIKE
ncbi:MAG: hypothetical protein EZS28_023452 [Streblomastix strix]|uniref:Uncharacterized protein n=1 Tax=Streblomastix strix TaxID=222440 RepID=A0A5J4VEI7_9EUKA|nr:MAG: hypothetical protein EZS28_023452 [Streblomastix strix]